MAKLSRRPLVLVAIGIVGLSVIILILIDSSTTSHDTPNTRSIGDDATAPSPRRPHEPTQTVSSSASHLSSAKSSLAGKVTENDITEAKAHLEQIPTGAAEYGEARRILGEIKSKKIKPMSEFELAHEGTIELMKQVDKGITYEKLKKNADKYKGSVWAITGQILEIQESGNFTVARVGLGSWGLDAVWVDGYLVTDFVAKDRVYVVGSIKGSKTYESQAGWAITIPHLEASAMVKPADAARLLAVARKK